MSKTCIVCLDDLGGHTSDPPPPVPPVIDNDAEPSDEEPIAVRTTRRAAKTASLSEDTLIAHLLPCGHNLHNECLKPWVERANSCPICRQSFNMVELCKYLDGEASTCHGLGMELTQGIGPAINSYAVNDKTQEAEVDPAMYIDDPDDLESRPCPICNRSDNEDVILLCDNCDAGYHTYCVDLDAVPDREWYCGECIINGALEPRGNHIPTARARAAGVQTRSQQRVVRLSNQMASASDWARVWRSVWDRLDIDLDFPFDDDAAAAQYQRSQQSSGRSRRRFRAWERRLQVAQQQGAGDRFEDSADTLLDRPLSSRPRPELPEPESAEELLAWNALEKARDIEADPSPKSRKQKSATSSPASPGPNRKKRKRSATASPRERLAAPVAERRFKRPQTRRILESNSSHQPESSASRANGTPALANGEGHSFLQSLLDEVESSTNQEEPQANGRPNLMISNPNSHSPSDHPSPQYSSPAASPTASNHPSPRALSASPPPMSNGRPGSPVPLTSKIEPLYPPAPDLSSESEVPTVLATRQRHRNSKSQTRVGRWAVDAANSSSPPRPRSEDNSPTRSMSFSAKENLQRLVKGALKEPYKNGQVTKDQYTEINRNVSHLLYDRVGEGGDINGHNEEALQSMAKDEVTKALQALQEAVE